MSEFESLNDALIAVVKAVGGSKKVAPLLWPEKSTDEAARLLCDCLNVERNQKISPDQALFIIGLGKKNNVHIGIEHICDSLSYSIPTPIEPEDQKASLMREFIIAQKNLSVLAAQIGGLNV
jgi:hypothetical protein